METPRLIDPFARAITYLRVSVTDRCDFRCVYCMSENMTFLPKAELLTLAELEALHLGLSVVTRAADEDMQKAADSLAKKIDAVLPEDRAAPASGWGFAVYPFAEAARGFVHMAPIRAAIRTRRKVQITYLSIAGDTSERTVRPLQMEYWGRVWTLTTWCELRGAFRVFRVDRIQTLDIAAEGFEDEAGKTLGDYLASLETTQA